MGAVEVKKAGNVAAGPVGEKAKAAATPKTVGAGFEAKGASKRRFDRFDWKTQVQILWLDEHARGSSLTMRTADLSAGGIGLLSSSWIHTGRRGAILLADRPGHRFVRWVEVLHGRYVSERKTHIIGCKWIPTPESAPPVRIVDTQSGTHLEFDTDFVAKSI